MGRALVGGKRGGSADLEAFGLELGGVEGVDGVEEEGEGGRIAAVLPNTSHNPTTALARRLRRLPNTVVQTRRRLLLRLRAKVDALCEH